LMKDSGPSDANDEGEGDEEDEDAWLILYFINELTTNYQSPFAMWN
jgi:hypothetical protein